MHNNQNKKSVQQKIKAIKIQAEKQKQKQSKIKLNKQSIKE
jgi:hypothetical protein